MSWNSGSRKGSGGVLVCKTCSIKHRGQCRVAQGNVCYHCGQSGHVQKDCPRRSTVALSQRIVCYRCGYPGHKSNVCTQPTSVDGSKIGGSSQMPTLRSATTRGQGATQRPSTTDRPQVVGKVFKLTTAEAKRGNETVQGSTHSFIASHVLHLVPIVSFPLSFVLSITTPSSSMLLGDVVMKDREIVVHDRVLLGDFVVLAIQDFDLLLGMDWLFRHYAKLEIVYRGVKLIVATPMISVMRAEKLIRQGSEAYLVFVTVTPMERKELVDFPIFWDFPDMFPDELPGLPPHWEIDFTIELLSDT
ncbi:uncharacterized protein LOC127809279 [Diospyros lotus]|uniref:uncharacterized protein LOC127809279 n=1 Tax=Diospyros lotus TaxID=55363 RepID=UPI00224FC4B7|nr:uncharacterized protein LOC127809279 [Diospyros lotus]